MHPLNCNCPNCRAAAGEFELYGAFEGEILSENEELELAMELLSIQNEQELEQFLGGLFKKVGSGLKSVGKFVSKKVLPVVGPALKSLAKTALPIAGGALGSLIPIPGVGTMIGRGLGQAVASALEMETAGMSPDQADIEKARRFIRIATTAMADASAALGSSPVVPGSAPAEQIARTVITNATRRVVPGVNPAVLRQVASGAGRSGRAASGKWWRRGNALVLEST
jgi:hypothetical protein